MALKSQASCWIILGVLAVAAWFIRTPPDGRRHAFTISLWAVAITFASVWVFSTSNRTVPVFPISHIGFLLIFLPVTLLFAPSWWNWKGVASAVAVIIATPTVMFVIEWCIFHSAAWAHPIVGFACALLPAAGLDYVVRAGVAAANS